MPKILTYNTPPKIAKEKTKEPFYKSFFDWYAQRDKFTKTYVVTFALIILVTPFIINNYLETRQRASGGPVRGVAGDLWADIVIGQPNFSELAPNSVVANRLNIPLGAIIDRTSTPQILYVYEAGNSRIIGLNWDNCLASATSCSAEKIIGQPNPNSGACNGDGQFQNFPTRAPASASTLCGIPEKQGSPAEIIEGVSMAVDSSGNLYTADFYNHRVLKYNRPYDTDSVADEVWGQDDFSGNLQNKGGNRSATSLFFSQGADNNSVAGVDIDSDGNLWVADSDNSRVLRFPSGSKTANLVLGQSDFTSKVTGNGLNQLVTPTAVRVTSQGVYVADAANQRVMRFKAPFTNGMAGEVFGSGFIKPLGIDLDPTEPGRIWIRDTKKALIELWDEASVTRIRTIGVQGQLNVIGGIDTAGSTAVDNAGNIVVPIASGANRQDVLLFTKGGSSTSPAKKLFNTGGIPNLITNNEFGRNVNGVVASDDQLIVADTGRILFWNGLSSLSNGKPADGYIGGFTYRALTSINDADPSCCAVIKADKNHHLWVTTFPFESYNSRILVYNLPLTNNAQPIKVITLPISGLGGSQVNYASFWDILFGIMPSDDGNFLWVSSRDQNRVFRVRGPLSANPVVDVVLGQTDMSGIQCNRGAPKVTGALPNSLCQPGPMSLDRLGNLWVSDHSLENEGNWRLLEFNNSLFPINNTSVIYAPAASKIFTSTAAWEPAFDSQNHMVIGYNYQGPRSSEYAVSFPGFYNSPLGASITADGFLKDFTSNAYAATFDSSDNLYMADLNRSRVLIYKNPFNTTVPSPSPTLSPTPTPSPSPSVGPTLSPSPVVSPTPTPSLDTSAPIVIITAPINGSKVTGQITISANATDNIKVTKMEVYINNQLKANSTINSILFKWNTNSKNVANGIHTILVKAHDARGNIGSSSISVTK